MATTTDGNSFLQRLVGAAALDSAIYEEVEADRGATGQAFAETGGEVCRDGHGSVIL